MSVISGIGSGRVPAALSIQAVSSAASSLAAPRAAMSSDTAGMERFFASLGLTYVSQPELRDEFERVAARNVADLMEDMRMRTRVLLSGDDADLAAKRDLECKIVSKSYRESFDEIDRGYVADLCVCYIDAQTGFGLFANSELEEGAFLGQYTGLVSAMTYVDLNTGYLLRMNRWDYDFKKKLGDGYVVMFIDAEKFGNELRFVNHISRNKLNMSRSRRISNVRLQSIYHSGLFRAIFFADRDIGAGEELRFDYGEAYWKNRVAPDDSVVYRVVGDRLVASRTVEASLDDIFRLSEKG